MELESFDERYKPVIDALKKIKQSPMLPDSLTMLGKLYKDILVEKGSPQPTLTPPAPIISEESKKSVWPASFLIKKAHQGPVANIFVTEMNTIISVGKTDNHINIWGSNGNKYKIIRTIIDEDSMPISKASFSPLSNMLAIYHTDRRFINIWNVQTGTKKRLGLLGKVSHIIVSPEPDILAVAYPNADDVEINHLLDIPGSSAETTINYHPPAQSLAFSPDGKIIAMSGMNTDVRTWHITWSERVPKKIKNYAVATSGQLSFLSDSELIAYEIGLSGSINIFDVATGKKTVLLSDGLKENIKDYSQLTISNSEKYGAFFAAGYTRKTIVWSVKTASIINMLDNACPVTTISFSPDNTMLVTGCEDGSISGWSNWWNQPQRAQ